jgi:vacuolar-type H+-ATPase subunit H
VDGPGKNSPLDLIRQTERGLAERLREAQCSAEQSIARARERAAEIQKSAEDEGRLEAEKFFEREMEGVEKAVAEIQAAGKEAADRLTRSGSERLDRAVEIIVDRLVPE